MLLRVAPLLHSKFLMDEFWLNMMFSCVWTILLEGLLTFSVMKLVAWVCRGDALSWKAPSEMRELTSVVVGTICPVKLARLEFCDACAMSLCLLPTSLFESRTVLLCPFPWLKLSS